ncbi:hypothetical protein EWM64_g1081 [Hericium alpestre]|uniref:SANT domain-containing protein n=1 Tax=Hericium alpestre TaxID=135208 RepID=A0A4Z0AAE8_9AGAM|nr:hypothetical protein EWM64_g1081 [Hericium alpestre]
MELSQSPQVGWKETPIEPPLAVESEASIPPAALTITKIKAVSPAPDVQMDMPQPIPPALASPIEQKPEAWRQPRIEPVLSQASLPPSSTVTEPTPPTEGRAAAQVSSLVSSTERSLSLKSAAPLEAPLSISVAPLRPSEPEDLAEVPAPPSVPKTVVDLVEGRNMSWQTKEARSLQEALQLVVSARQMYDRQPREARVTPVLMANHALHRPLLASTSTPESLMDEVLTENGRATRDPGGKDQALASAISGYARSMAESLRALDNLSQIAVPEEVATVTGRTTRRSAAVLGDAVRSDLEMEQIIASLGNEDMMDPAHLSLRNVATIPDMISVTHGTVDYMFDDTNNVVDDPASFYETGRRMGSWTEEEQVIFLEKFAAHPKQFGIIADGLPHKTQAECVQFYYMHKKKVIDFRRLVSRYGPRKRGGRKTDKKKGNALLADILKHDAEVSKRSKTSNGRRKRTVAAVSGEPRRANSRRTAVQAAQVEQTPTTTPTPEPEAEPRPKRRRVGNSRLTTQPLEPEDVDCDATDVEPQPRPRRARKTRKTRGAVAVSVTPPDVESPVVETRASTRFIDQTESTSRRKATAATVHWSDDDKALFLKLLSQYGDDFKRIAASMPNKTTIQVSAFYKTNQVDLDLKQVAACAPKRSPTPDMSSENGKAVPPLPGTGIMSPSTNTIILANGIESTSLSMIPYEASEKATRVFDASVSLAGLPYPPAVSDTMHGLVDDASKRPYTQILPRPRTASGDYPSDLRVVDAQPPPPYSPFSQKPYTYSTPHPSPNPLFSPPPPIVSGLFSVTSPPVPPFGVSASQPRLGGPVVASYTESRLPGSLDSH